MTLAMDKPGPPFPRAPTQAAWDAMSADERARVMVGLTASMTEAELHAPEGDAHFDAKVDARESLRTFFDRMGRRVYVAAELTVYYPDADRFSPDVMAVTDVAVHPRERWVVSAEGKGLDWVLEVLVLGDRRKDLERNVVRYAELGIPEYFVLDVRRSVLRGYRLPAPGMRRYEPILAQHGVLQSRVLGLDLVLQDRRLRFRQGNAELLATREIIERLETFAEERVAALEEAEQRAREAEQRSQEAEQRSQEAERRSQEAEQRSQEAARRVAELQAEIERLRRG